MKEITQELITKRADIDLRMEVSMDGETIIKRKADSLVGNFMRLLYGMMGKTGNGNKRRVLRRDDRESEYATLSGEIDSIEWGPPVKIHFSNDNRGYANGHLRYVYSNIPEMRGLYQVDGSDWDWTLREVDIDYRNGTYTKTGDADWSSVDQSQWKEELWFRRFAFGTGWRRHQTFQDPNIFMGHNTPGTNSQINDQWLEDQIRAFSTTGTTISEPAVSTNDSEITLSRTFTNNKSYPITVGEIGVFSRVDRHGYCLIARDNVSDFTVSSNSSVTIDYTITLSNNGSGGMMAQFHQQLFRQFRNGNRNVRDINNNDRNNRDSPGQWIGAASGGGMETTAHNGSTDGEFIGPVAGTTTNQIANTNVSLGGDPSNDDGQVPHGDGDGKMYYYGAVVEDLHVDEANNEIWFDISRLMENRGNTTITIKETGLYTGYIRDDYDQDYPFYSVLTSRHLLDTSVDVAPGEVFKLNYRMKLVI